mgnify:CR=1 FL=1
MNGLFLQLTWTAEITKLNADLVFASETIISYLPLSHIAGALLDIFITISVAATVYFAQPDALRVR